MTEIVIKGKRYKLLPLDEEVPQNALQEATGGILEAYGSPKISKVGVAVPKVSDYRERYKKHAVRPGELVARPTYPTKLIKRNQNRDMGPGDFFGPGLEIDA